jgi:hypothetical protein
MGWGLLHRVSYIGAASSRGDVQQSGFSHSTSLVRLIFVVLAKPRGW